MYSLIFKNEDDLINFDRLQARMAHYRELEARFERKGSLVQISYTQKSIQELERRLRNVMQRNTTN